MARVVLEHVDKVFKGPKGQAIHAVRDVCLAVEDQELVVLVGPSGCGKSTTLRLIAGLEEVSAGQISIGGHVVNNVAPQDRDVAMVFQNYALYPHMTVYENLAFGLQLRRSTKPEIDRRVQEVGQTLGLTPFLDRLPKALSGGQRQRVAVGRAIVRRPKVFLLDEPLSNLDANMRLQMRLELARLHRRLAATMIYVTHDQVEAMTLGERIAVMNEGRIQQAADPLTLYRAPANLFVAGFIGSPPMNCFRGLLDADHQGLVFREQPGPPTGLALRVADEHLARLAPRAGRPVVLGLRPEDIVAERGNEPASGERCARATVELVEPTGPDTYLHLTTGGLSFVARVHPGRRVAVGDALNVCFHMAGAHYFDPATGQAW
jgi:multiple sugar transport system ATP-binding protein